MNKVAAAISTHSTPECLEELQSVSNKVGVAEVRLDMMDEFDLKALITQSPVPLVITYRPSREGGHFQGDEKERLNVLQQAIELGAAYVDVESDALQNLDLNSKSNTKIMVSKHWWDAMPDELMSFYESFADKADVVKIVGMANSIKDIKPVLDLLNNAQSPVIALAMGKHGLLTRLVGPAFDNCELTYGATSEKTATAPGQITVGDMTSIFHLHEVNVQTKWTIAVTDGDNWGASFQEDSLEIKMPIHGEDEETVRTMLQTALPSFAIS